MRVRGERGIFCFSLGCIKLSQVFLICAVRVALEASLVRQEGERGSGSGRVCVCVRVKWRGEEAAVPACDSHFDSQEEFTRYWGECATRVSFSQCAVTAGVCVHCAARGGKVCTCWKQGTSDCSLLFL